MMYIDKILRRASASAEASAWCKYVIFVVGNLVMKDNIPLTKNVQFWQSNVKSLGYSVKSGYRGVRIIQFMSACKSGSDKFVLQVI